MLSLRDFLSECARFTETTASLHKGFGNSFVEDEQSKSFVVLQAIEPRRKSFSDVFMFHLERRADFGFEDSDPASRHVKSRARDESPLEGADVGANCGGFFDSWDRKCNIGDDTGGKGSCVHRAARGRIKIRPGDVRRDCGKTKLGAGAIPGGQADGNGCGLLRRA